MPGMPDVAQITGLISDIYDAALDSSHWPHVLRRTMTLLDGVSAAIFSDAELPAESFYCSVDVDPHFAALYVAHYVGLNPLVPFEESLPAGAVFSASDGMPYEALRASPFFNEWARPQQLADFIGAVIERSPRRMVKLMVNRHERTGPVDAAARQTMQLLAPHFRRAIAIGKVLERGEGKATALGEVLDRLSAAVVLVDKAGRLVHANGPAAAMLAEGECLRWEEGKPRPQCERAASHLRSLLAMASRGNGSAACTAFYTDHTTRTGERVAIHILPVPAGSRRHALASIAAAAAVLVSRIGPDATHRLEHVSRLYALTPAEARVLQAVLDSGATVGRVADSLGIAEATVKTHLQHIFDKTGARRRADLFQLIAAGSSMAAGAQALAQRPRDGRLS